MFFAILLPILCVYEFVVFIIRNRLDIYTEKQLKFYHGNKYHLNPKYRPQTTNETTSEYNLNPNMNPILLLSNTNNQPPIDEITTTDREDLYQNLDKHREKIIRKYSSSSSSRHLSIQYEGSIAEVEGKNSDVRFSNYRRTYSKSGLAHRSGSLEAESNPIPSEYHPPPPMALQRESSVEYKNHDENTSSDTGTLARADELSSRTVLAQLQNKPFFEERTVGNISNESITESNNIIIDNDNDNKDVADTREISRNREDHSDSDMEKEEPETVNPMIGTSSNLGSTPDISKLSLFDISRYHEYA